MAQNIRAKQTIQLVEEEGTNDPSTPTNPPPLLDLSALGALKLDLPQGYPRVQVVNYAPPHPEARGRPRGEAHRDRHRVKYYRQSKSLPSSAASSPTRESTRFFHESYHDRASIITYHDRPTSLTPDFSLLRRDKVRSLLQPPPAQQVVVPVVLSQAPPHPKARERTRGSVSSCASDKEMSGNGGSGTTVSAMFEVCVPGVCDDEEVRITGNVTAMGSWNVKSSVPLNRHEELKDTWYISLDIPADVTVKYRYLIVKKLSSPSGGSAIDISRWETTLHPRECCLRRPSDEPDGPGSPDTEGSREPLVLKGDFGENDVGEKAEDDGWLVGASELHLQLFPTPEGGPIKIASLPEKTCYSVKVESMMYDSQPGDVIPQCSPLKVKLMDREKGDCEFRDQDDYGCSFHQDTQMLIFHTRAPSFKKYGFTVDVYRKEGPPSAKCDQGDITEAMMHVGRTSILPAQYLSGTSKGQLTLTLFSPQLISIGTITFSYLLIHPVTDSQSLHFTKYSYAHYWKEHKRALDIGHRGSGDSYHTDGELKPTVTENTISSLKQAGLHGADYVEFDVQLTKDLIPVVYHNFKVCTTLARQGYFSGELYEMFVKDLTLSQLQQLKLDHSSVLSQRSRDSADGGGRRSGYNSSGSGGENSYDSDSSMETYWGVGSYKEVLPERKTFPTLKQVFKSIPSHVGFNIEVKYPVRRQDAPSTNFDYFDRNMMADIILHTVYRHAHRRKIIFSCFDADMCTILRLKQPKYPVVFLTTNLYHLWGVPTDAREATVYDAMMHARAEKLLGIDVHSTHLLANPDLVDTVKKRELVVFTWGQDNNKVENIELQKKMGVDAVIFDCLSILIPRQKNVFQIEAEEEREKLQRYWQERKERMEKKMQMQTLKNIAATMPKIPTKTDS